MVLSTNKYKFIIEKFDTCLITNRTVYFKDFVPVNTKSRLAM